MTYEVFADKQIIGAWRVEASDNEAGEVYITIFIGPDAERRAREYVQFKSGGK